jgi:hypothetical protein
MTWQEWLNQQQIAGGGAPAAGAGAASIPASSIPGAGGNNNLTGVAAGVGGMLGGNPGSTDASLGGGIGDIAGTIGGSLLGIPFLGAAGGFIGDLIGSLFGGGVPREAKTSALGGALEGSGNPLDAIVGQFVGQGASAGRVLSESGSSTFGQSTEDLAAYLSALTGQQLPNVTATGFQHNPSFLAPGLGNAGTNFKIPAGYNFMDPSQAQNASSIIEKIIGMQQPAGQLKPAEADWQKIVSQLISKGDLTKYNGPMGAAGGQPTSASAIPNLSLPHPLAQNQPQTTPAPYPLTTGA